MISEIHDIGEIWNSIAVLDIFWYHPRPEERFIQLVYLIAQTCLIAYILYGNILIVYKFII